MKGGKIKVDILLDDFTFEKLQRLSQIYKKQPGRVCSFLISNFVIQNFKIKVPDDYVYKTVLEKQLMDLILQITKDMPIVFEKNDEAVYGKNLKQRIRFNINNDIYDSLKKYDIKKLINFLIDYELEFLSLQKEEREIKYFVKILILYFEDYFKIEEQKKIDQQYIKREEWEK